ncbi:MAG: DUF115 domain-containing protein [Candidatus Nanoarchaeia archaeon]|jgi:hypothetical protein|nr:DUF115 domain-containing protein [Candidatus Nanoarchaeia archaeon]
MRLNLNNIINRHKNIPALVIAHGPSLNEYLPILDQLKQKGIILIDCNEFYDFHKVNPTYWCFASSVLRIDNQINYINKTDSVIVYANSVDFTNKNWIEQNIKTDIIAYDQRHFQYKTCNELMQSSLKNYGGYSWNGLCCNNIDRTRLTIQEELQKMTMYSKHYKTGDSIAVHELALAVLLGCNPVYFIGIDLDYRLGYANNIKYNVPMDGLSENYDRIVEDMEIIRDSAKVIGIELINLNNLSYLPFNKGKIE